MYFKEFLCGQTYTIPSGYHNGSGTVRTSISGLVASNIRKGASIAGVSGTMLPWVPSYSTYYNYANFNIGLTGTTYTSSYQICGYRIILQINRNDVPYQTMEIFNNMFLCGVTGHRWGGIWHVDNFYDENFNKKVGQMPGGTEPYYPPYVIISGTNNNILTMTWPTYGSRGDIGLCTGTVFYYPY